MVWSAEALKEVDFGGPKTEQASDRVVGHAGCPTDGEYPVGVLWLGGDDRSLDNDGVTWGRILRSDWSC